MTTQPTDAIAVEARLPRINVTDEDVPTVAGQAWAALRAANDAAHPRSFHRIGNLPCVRTREGVAALTKETLTYWLARTAIFFKERKNGEKVVKPPAWLVNDMLA